MPTLPLLPSLLLGTAALACLCLSQPRYAQRSIPPLAFPVQRLLRVGGWLILGLLLLVSGPGGIGLVQAFGSLSFAALVVAGVATWRPSRLPVLCLSGLAGTLVLIAVAIAVS